MKARTGTLLNFTGVSNPFENPKTALFSIDTTHLDIDSCVDKLFIDVIELIKKEWFYSFLNFYFRILNVYKPENSFSSINV